MRNLNVIVLNGRIGKDIEIKKTNSGKTVTNFPLAVQYDKETMWINVTAWERCAEVLDKYCHKGSMIGVDGRLWFKEWEKDGEKKSRNEIIANNIYLLDTPPKKDSSDQQDGQYKDRHDDQKRDGYQKQEPAQDDIPF